MAKRMRIGATRRQRVEDRVAMEARRMAGAIGMGLNRYYQHAGDLQAVVDHELLLKFWAAFGEYDFALVLAYIEYLGLFVLQSLEHYVVCLDHVAIALLTKDSQVADHAAEIARRKGAGVADRDYPVFHHSLGGARHGRDREVALYVFTGQDFVNAIL